MSQEKLIPQRAPDYYINYSDITEMVRWRGEAFSDIYFADDSTAKVEGLPMRVISGKREGHKQYRNIRSGRFTPFILDTAANRFYAHTSWFDWLKATDATKRPGKVTVGRLAKKFTITQQSVTELFELLLEFGVVTTYFHLPARLWIVAVREDERFIGISYDCLFNYCTTRCFDVAYRFELLFDKQTRELILVSEEVPGVHER